MKPLKNTKSMDGDTCEYCDGVIRLRILPQEVFKHPKGFIILENAPVGVCDKCHHRYYSAALLKRIEAVATGKESASRTEQVPVASFQAS